MGRFSVPAAHNISQVNGWGGDIPDGGTTLAAPSGAYGFLVWGAGAYQLNVAQVGSAMAGTAYLPGTALVPFAMKNLGSVTLTHASGTVRGELAWLILQSG